MSLHQIANHVQNAGRGEDKVLVHMTPGEVKGLQAIAMSHGGSLTINPQTGLPEAGFLSSILPMVAGFALGPAGFGIAQSALGAGAMVGGATALATGSLSKGLMAGFGAYGGFGIGEGLAAAGANAMGNAGANAAAGSVDDIAASAAKFKSNATAGNLENFVGTGKNAVTNTATNAATSGGLPGYQAQGYNNIFSNPNYGNYTPINNLGEVSRMPISGTAGTSLDVTIGSKVPPMPTKPIVDASKFNPNAYNAPVNQITSSSAPPSYMDKVGAGFKDVTSSGDKAWNFVKSNPAPFITAGLGLAQDVMGNKSGAAAPASGPSYLRPYDFSIEQDPNAYAANDSTAERRYFKEPRYTALPIQQVASGGLLGMAQGGLNPANTLALPDRPPVEQATAEQAIGQNMSFPMANQRSPAYSTPTNRPQMHEVIDPSGGPEVDPYTGEPRFASGGLAHYEIGGMVKKAIAAQPTTDSKYSYNPETMQYTQTTTSAPANDLANAFQKAGLGMFTMVPNLGSFMMGHPNIPNPLYKAQQAPQPTATTEVSGGMMQPAMQAQSQMQAANPITPNINIPQYQTPEQQLGLEGFYGMMDAQLAKKGAQLQGMASGGIARFGNGGMQFTPEGQAKQDYMKSQGIGGQNGPRGIMRIIPDDGWARIKKENNISIPSAASAAPTYNYNPQNMQFTDNAGAVSGGMENQYMPDQQLGLNAFQGYANGGMAGMSHLGGYSDGGRLLRGPGDGVSDSIPASIGNRQPARLADGEFVVPARIVSEIGNGSTEAGARKLYAMMDRVQKARRKTVGKGKVAVNSKSERFLPA